MPLPRLAPQRSNPGTNGSNVRYDVRGYPIVDGRYVDPAGFHYRGDVDNALSDDRPDTVQGGLFPADDERARQATYAGMPGQWVPGAPMPNQGAPRLIGQASRMVQARKQPSAVPTANPAYGRAQGRVAPVIAGAASALIEALIGKATRSTDEINTRTGAIESALGGYAPKASGYYGDAAAQAQGVGGAVADAIRATGGALQSDLAGKLAGIQAPAQAVDLEAGGAGSRGAASAAAAGALSSADIEQLRGQGAAASDYMGALPRIASLAGDEQRRGVLNQIGGELTDKLAELYGKEPGMILDAIDAETKAAADAAKQSALERYRQQQIRQGNARIAESRRYHDTQAGLAEGRLGVSQTNAQTSRMNAVTSRGRLDETAAQHAQANAQAWARIATGQKNAGVAASRNQLAWEKFKANPTGNGSDGGYTKSMVGKLRTIAGQEAEQAFKGYWALADDPETPLTQTQLLQMMRAQDVTSPTELAGVGHGTRSYQEAMTRMLNAGVPLVMAQAALNRYWTKPGDPRPGYSGKQEGRPAHSFQERHPGASGKAAAAPSGGIVLPTSWRGTHTTDNLGWGAGTAEDIMEPAGTPLGAPEDATVVYFHPTGAQGGGSMMLRTASGREYWLGHIAKGLAPGTRVRKGQLVAYVADQHVSAPHVHIDRRG